MYLFFVYKFYLGFIVFVNNEFYLVKKKNNEFCIIFYKENKNI